MKKTFFVITIGLFFIIPIFASADSVGDRHTFYIDSSYDLTNRATASAVLIKSGSKLNIYADESWWNFTSQTAAQAAINALNFEFDNRIYPILTSIFGQEWNPGIDDDTKITVLIQSMKGEAGGYFRTNDEYPKLQVTDSNEREMVYINSKYILDPNLKTFFAHELTHLITFNQKNEKYNVEEDTWLNETRAEYVSTLLGYNSDYDGSYLEKRVQYFSEKPTGSLIDWQNTKYDYGRASLFAHYLVDHYGINILSDSLHSPKVGVDSLNYALQKNGFKEDFSQIFSDWTIAVSINDCNYGVKYCYLNKSLKDFYLNPQVNFLPLVGNSSLTMADKTKSWSANWYKIIGGGGGTLKFSFEGDPNVSFSVAYIAKNQSGSYVIKLLMLDKFGKGEFSIQNFGKDIPSLFIIPYLKGDGGALDNFFHSFFWSASITREQSNIEEINRLLAIIDNLKKQIADILAQRQGGGGNIYCSQLINNLYPGMTNNNEVKCLQQFLTAQGMYAGLIAGNYGPLTRAAVVSFQEKYLVPLPLVKTTGNVGPTTKQKINTLLIVR